MLALWKKGNSWSKVHIVLTATTFSRVSKGFISSQGKLEYSRFDLSHTLISLRFEIAKIANAVPHHTSL